MAEALVLNATYEPLCVVPGRRAVVLVLTEKAVTVAGSDELVHSTTVALPVPCVVRLTRFVKVPFRPSVPLTRKAVFARDGGRCVYCGAAATSLDHVVPKSRGGSHTWDNVVSACGRCNHVKADRAVAAAMLNALWRVDVYEHLAVDWNLDRDDAVGGITWVIGLIVDAVRAGRRPGDGLREPARGA